MADKMTNGHSAEPAAPPVEPPPAAAAAAPPAAATIQPSQKLRFDMANIKSTDCNVCNATSTREEVVINFGINKTWDMTGAAGKDMEVQLEHRIILSPYAAKRLQDLLARLITEHEQRYGELR